MGLAFNKNYVGLNSNRPIHTESESHHSHTAWIRLLLYLLAVLTAILLLWKPPAISQRPQHPSRGTLRSASELDYPPFALIRQDGSADGFSVALLRAVAEKLHLSIDFKVEPWHQIKRDLSTGDLDVLPLVSYSKERDRIYDFSAPYLRMHGTIFVRRGESSIRTQEDLAGKEVVVMRDDTAHEYALKELISTRLILTDSFEEALMLLSQGRHDAVLIQQLVGLQLIKKLGIDNLVDVSSAQETSLKPNDRPLSGFEQKFCFAVQEGDKDLLALLNEGLAIVVADGTYDSLYEKWFGPILPHPPVPLTTILTYLLYVLIPLAVAFSLGGIWYLRKQIRRKTQTLREEVEERKAVQEKLKYSEKIQSIRSQIAEIFATMPEDDMFAAVSHILLQVTGSRLGLFAYIDENGMTVAPCMVGEVGEPCLPNGQSIQIRMDDHEDNIWSSCLQTGCPMIRNEPGPLPDSQTWADNLIVVPLRWQEQVIGCFGLANRDEGYGQTEQTILTDLAEYVAPILKARLDRQRVEKALRESESKFRGLFQNAVVGFFQCTPEGRFTAVNPTFAGILGYRSSEDAISGLTHMDEHFFSNPADQESFEGLLNRFGVVEGFEFEARRTDDSRVWVSIYTHLVRSEDGTIVRHEGFIQDISERRRLNQEREKLERQLRQAQKMEAIGTLAGGIAHDFNNILSAVIGFSELALDDAQLGSPLYQNLRDVLAAGARAKELVHQILTFSRQTDQEKRLFKLQPIVKEALKLLRSSMPRSIDIEQDLDPNCGPVFADPTQVHQIVMNLATNAMHAMEETGGKMSVIVKRVHVEHDFFRGTNTKEYARISVVDNGCGIPPDAIEKIFDPYYSTKIQSKGTGLGLSVVQGIVKNSGGEIRVYSEPGKGSAFHVYLPLVEGDSEKKALPETPPLIGGRERILLVDDEEPIVRIEKAMLEGLGYQVEAKTNSIEAIDEFSRNPNAYDLIITDMTMPGMAGDQLAKTVQAITPRQPIIICTGFSERLGTNMAKTLGIKGALMKPVTKSELAHTVRAVLDDNHRSS